MLKLRFITVLLFLISGAKMLAQDTFIIEGDTVNLQQEVKGTLSLFWNEEENRYRYFVQKGNRMVELKNQDVEGEERKKFQLQLETLTRDADMYTGDVKFLLYSLKHFANRYNAKVQEDYEYNASSTNIKQRVALFTGLSNNKYTRNPNNVLVPVLGLEYELYDPNLAPRHSAFVHLRHSFQQDEYRYTSTQLSINYRFKVLYFSGFDIHIDTELATFYHSANTIYLTNDEGEITGVEEESGYSFTSPLSFGIGTDIKLTERSFLTFSYNDVVSIVLDSNGSFPVDFTIGYKYNL